MCVAAAGFSVGEFAALVFSGAMNFAEGKRVFFFVFLFLFFMSVKSVFSVTLNNVPYLFFCVF